MLKISTKIVKYIIYSNLQIKIFMLKVRRLADLILEEKQAKAAKERHKNEEIETRKKEEQSAKVARE